jgi:hypothetical protein
MARTFTSTRDLAAERLLYRVIGVDSSSEQTWRAYLRGVLAFSLVGMLLLYLLQRTPGLLGRAVDADDAVEQAFGREVAGAREGARHVVAERPVQHHEHQHDGGDLQEAREGVVHAGRLELLGRDERDHEVDERGDGEDDRDDAEGGHRRSTPFATRATTAMTATMASR